MAMITNDWLTALGGEFHKPYTDSFLNLSKMNMIPPWYFPRRMIFSMHFI